MKRTAQILLLVMILNLFAPILRADEIDDVTRELQSKQSEYQQTQQKIDQLKSDQEKLSQDLAGLGTKLSATQANINSLSSQINSTREKIKELEQILSDRQTKLDKQQQFRDTLIVELYKKSQVSSFELLLADNKLTEAAQRIAFHSSSINEAKKVISDLNREITQFNNDKKTIEDSKKKLEANLAQIARIKNDLVKQESTTKTKLAEAAKEKSAAESQIQSLESAIKGLTSKQRELIASKFAASTQNTSIGDNAPVSVALPSSPFKPGYAFASYGYPHRVGLNQYGAYGRAKDGQNFRQILEVYYNLDGSSLKLTEGYAVPDTISVEGYGNIAFEDNYLKGIAEMPSSWSLEALKAQAVAARSYALAYVSSGGTICTDQRCQVYIGHNKGGAWEQAVNETKGMVLTYNGSPITAWYASTAGGYTRTSEDVWGNGKPWTRRLKDFGSGGAYDGPAYGSSPWYHKAWGDREGGKNCRSGGYNPWLSGEELEDIFNAFLLSQLDPGLNQFLSPPDGCNSSSSGWSASQVKDELSKRGKKEIGKITDVFTTQDGTGYTDYIYVNSANYAQTRFDGYQFKNIFNLRSIGNLVIWTSYYDILVN